MLSVELSNVMAAVSVACWLRFALRLPRQDGDRIVDPGKGLYKTDSDLSGGMAGRQKDASGLASTAAGAHPEASEPDHSLRDHHQQQKRLSARALRLPQHSPPFWGLCLLLGS